MIGWLRGTVRSRETGRIVLDVGGVGYAVSCPMSTFLALPPDGTVVELHVSTQVREDSITLHGFAEAVERELFERLLSVSGVGPRMALSILLQLPLKTFAHFEVEYASVTEVHISPSKTEVHVLNLTPWRDID